MDDYTNISGVSAKSSVADTGDILDAAMDDSNVIADTIGETIMPASFFVTEQNMGGYTKSVLIVCAVSCILSILGSFVIFGSYAVMPEIRNFTRKLILSLTAADFLTAAGYILGTSQYVFNNDSGNDVICRVQSYITTYSSLVSFLLTIMTAVHIYITVVKQPDFPSRQRLVLFNLISWIIPVVIIAVAGSKGVLGATKATGTGPWCWIETGEKHLVMWQLVTGKGLEIVCYIATTSLYVLLKLYLYIRHRHERFRTFHSSLRDEDQNFLYVWFIFYIIRIWGTIRFFISAIHPETNPNAILMRILLHLQAFGDPAQAFCNCILFCFLDKAVRRRLCSRYYRNMCDYKELKDPTPEDNKALISGENSENAHQNRQLNSSDPINYGSTNSRLDESEDAYSCTYDSPMSTPCFTPRVLTPASFCSIHSNE